MTIYEVAGIALVFGPIGTFLCRAIWALFLHMLSAWKAHQYAESSWQPTPQWPPRQENLSPEIQKYKEYNAYRKENRQYGIARFAIKPSAPKPSSLDTGQVPVFKLENCRQLADDTIHKLKNATGKLK